MQAKRKQPGVRVRHSRSCPAASSREVNCRCSPSYEAWAFSVRDGKKVRKTFPTLAAAKGWRADATSAIRKGAMRAPSSTTLREAADAWLEGAREGTIRTRSGDRYKPSVLRGYEQALRTRLLPELGRVRLSEISHSDVQDLGDRLLGEGLNPSTIRNALMPLRVIFRRSVARGVVTVNPTTGVELPAVRGRRDRIASPTEAAALIQALPEADRALWACAFYAGLRLGELKALRDEDVDLAAGVLHVQRSWDKIEGPIEPKSRAGVRKVPIVAALRVYLAAHRLRIRRGGLFFGEGGAPFKADAVRSRAAKLWKSAGLEPIGFHEARHSYASLAIAAGVNAKALSTYMGHSSITITLDRYGHLMPGNERETAALLDQYLAGAQTGAHTAGSLS